MNGTSTYVVGLDVGALTGLEGVPESARNTPTGTATRTLRSDLSQSPALPSSNGDSSTPYRVRPNLTINPHALPNEHRRRADEGHILTPHTHLYDSPGNERALRPSSLPASNISPVSTKSHQSTASRPSVGTHRLSGAYWMDAFRGRKPLEAPVASPDGGLGDGSTSFKASTARKLRSATNPHWTDALWQSGSELPSKAPASDPPPSFDRVYVLREPSPVSPLTVTFPEGDGESTNGVPTPAQDSPAPSSPSSPNVRRRISIITLPKSSTVTLQQPSETSLAGPSRNDETDVDRLQASSLITLPKPPSVTFRQPSETSPARSSQNETEVDRLQESRPNLPHAAAEHDRRDSPPPRRVPNKVNDTLAKAFTPRDRQALPQPQQDFNTTQPVQQEVMSSAKGHSSQDFNTTQFAQPGAASSEEGHPSQPPPSILTTIDKGKGKDPRPLALVEGDDDMESGTAWHLNDIRSNFAHDLTGHVIQESEQPVAFGSFGDIYRGTLRMRGRTIRVAMKAIRTYSADDGGDAKKKKRIRREIKTWLNLDHNNVLPLLGTTMNFGQFPAMVCPWLENGPLISYLERRYEILTAVERLTLVSDVAAGLQYLHSRSVVHGDLSGANVLIDADGRACISDFGLSTLLTQLGGSTFATTRQGPGTLRWTAPELLDLQEPADEEDPPHVVPSPQSDVFSFGRIMLQVLTGKVPYHYLVREVQVVYAISRGINPNCPSSKLVTNCQWTFIKRCWTPVNVGELRPRVEEIVEFVRQELVEIKKAAL